MSRVSVSPCCPGVPVRECLGVFACPRRPGVSGVFWVTRCRPCVSVSRLCDGVSVSLRAGVLVPRCCSRVSVCGGFGVVMVSQCPSKPVSRCLGASMLSGWRCMDVSRCLGVSTHRFCQVYTQRARDIDLSRTNGLASLTSQRSEACNCTAGLNSSNFVSLFRSLCNYRGC